MHPEERALEALVGVFIAYEVVAVLSRRRLPTLSSICRNHRWFEGLLLAGLLAHWHYERRLPIEYV
jgi:hypothetical protein